MAVKKDFPADLIQNLDHHLQQLAKKNETIFTNITSGLKLAYEKF